MLGFYVFGQIPLMSRCKLFPIIYYYFPNQTFCNPRYKGKEKFFSGVRNGE